MKFNLQFLCNSAILYPMKTPNPFQYSDNNKRYHTQDYYLRHRFGCKVMKIPLNIDCTCPNIDGTKGTGGCTFCTEGSGHFAGDRHKSITEQFSDECAVYEKKWGKGLYIPYFQANTNTYCDTEKLRRCAAEALSHQNTVGLAISTRPDCISPAMANLLGELSQQTYLTVELGVQTVHDETARRINRCHTYDDVLIAADMLCSKGVNICAHIIDGLPGEDFDMMMDTARAMAKLPLHSIKIHLLHVLKGTPLAADLLEGRYTPLTREEYVDIICAQLEVLPPALVIQRLTGDGARDELLAPLWSLKKLTVLNEIDKQLARTGSMQGLHYRGDV